MQTRRWLPILLLVAVAASILLFATLHRQARPLIELSDGSKLKLTDWSRGRQIRFFRGALWQKVLYVFGGTNLPPRFTGSEFTLSSMYTDGSSGFEFTRYIPGDFLRDGWNGSGQLVVIDDQGNEIAGFIGLVNFNTARRDGLSRIVSEEIIWEFPVLTQKQIRFRLIETNRHSQAVLTNDFTIDNPIREAAGR